MGRLKVGDVVYRMYYGKPSGRITIERLTKTQAISGKTRFKQSDSNYLRVVGGAGFGSTYSMETPEIKKEYYRELIINNIKRIDFTTLPIEDLEAIYKILNKTD